MRRDQIFKICCNHYITEDMKLFRIDNDRCWTWYCLSDYSDEIAKEEKFAVKFKTSTLASNFKDVFENCTKMHHEIKSEIKEGSGVLLSSESQSESNFWECSCCYVRNTKSESTCVSCGAPSPTEAQGSVAGRSAPVIEAPSGLESTDDHEQSGSSEEIEEVPANSEDSKSDLRSLDAGTEVDDSQERTSDSESGGGKANECNVHDKISDSIGESREVQNSSVDEDEVVGASTSITVAHSEDGRHSSDEETETYSSVPNKSFHVADILEDSGDHHQSGDEIEEGASDLLETRSNIMSFKKPELNSVQDGGSTHESGSEENNDYNVLNSICDSTCESSGAPYLSLDNDDDDNMETGICVPHDEEETEANESCVSGKSTPASIIDVEISDDQNQTTDTDNMEECLTASSEENKTNVQSLEKPNLSQIKMGDSTGSACDVPNPDFEQDEKECVKATSSIGVIHSKDEELTDDKEEEEVNVADASPLKACDDRNQRADIRFTSSLEETESDMLVKFKPDDDLSIDFAEEKKSSSSGGTLVFTDAMAQQGNLQSEAAFISQEKIDEFDVSGSSQFPLEQSEECGGEENEPDASFKSILTQSDSEKGQSHDEDEILFERRCRLKRYDQPSSKWKDIGSGVIRVFVSRSSNKPRILMKKGDQEICCSHYITEDMKLLPKDNDKQWVWNCHSDSLEEAAKEEKNLVRFKTSVFASQFKDAFEKCVKKACEVKEIKTVEVKPSSVDCSMSDEESNVQSTTASTSATYSELNLNIVHDNKERSVEPALSTNVLLLKSEEHTTIKQETEIATISDPLPSDDKDEPSDKDVIESCESVQSPTVIEAAISLDRNECLTANLEEDLTATLEEGLTANLEEDLTANLEETKSGIPHSDSCDNLSDDKTHVLVEVEFKDSECSKGAASSNMLHSEDKEQTNVKELTETDDLVSVQFTSVTDDAISAHVCEHDDQHADPEKIEGLAPDSEESESDVRVATQSNLGDDGEVQLKVDSKDCYSTGSFEDHLDDSPS